MSSSTGDNITIPAGYLSEEGKKKFTILAGVLGALFLLGQMIIPFISMIFMMPMFTMTGGFEMNNFSLNRGAYWKDGVWFVNSVMASSFRGTERLELWSFNPASDEEPGKITSLEFDDPWLSAEGDRLWIISSEAVGFFDGKELHSIDAGRRLGDISRPFRYNGNLAVVEGGLFGQRIMVLVNNRWEERETFEINAREGEGALVKHLQVVAAADSLFLFVQSGDSIYYRKGIPDENDKNLTPIGKGYAWTALAVEGDPVVFFAGSENRSAGRIKGLRLHGGIWREIFRSGPSFSSELAVFHPGKGNEYLIITQLFPGNLRQLKVKGSEIENEKQYGSGFPFSGSFLYIMFIPYTGMMLMPLILALVLSSLMSRYRVDSYTADEIKVPYAPLWRRAFSQVIDALILGFPTAAGYIKVFSNFGFMTNPFDMFKYMGLILLGFIWAMLGLIVYSYLEGTWGQTPGKWALGIKVVGTDLKPCGFGRGFVRNILKLVDGFFNFIVGILLVALTENWQRVGDLAARTVVVMKEKQAKDLLGE